MFRLYHCCCCFSLKGGIIILGIWESFWMVLTILSMIGSVFYGLNKDYNILPVFITPLLTNLPIVLAFYQLLCRSFSLPSRWHYFRVRMCSLVLLLLCTIIQIITAWVLINKNYSS